MPPRSARGAPARGVVRTSIFGQLQYSRTSSFPSENISIIPVILSCLQVNQNYVLFSVSQLVLNRISPQSNCKITRIIPSFLGAIFTTDNTKAVNHFCPFRSIWIPRLNVALCKVPFNHYPLKACIIYPCFSASNISPVLRITRTLSDVSVGHSLASSDIFRRAIMHPRTPPIFSPSSYPRVPSRIHAISTQAVIAKDLFPNPKEGQGARDREQP